MQFRIVGLALISFIVICIIIYFSFSSSDNSLKRLQKNNVIRIGYAIEAPYVYVGSNGEITGESSEVAKYIVNELGISNIEWVQTDFDSLIQGLLDNRYDVIAAGLFITPERAKLVHFSEPTFHVQSGLLVQAGNPLQLHSYQDILNNSAKVAVISGSIEEIYLRSIGLTDQLIIVPDALTGNRAVTSGLVDGLALSSVTVRWMAANDLTGRTEAATPFNMANIEIISSYGGYGGFAFRPEDQELLAAWNTALEAFIGSSDHIDLIAQFGFTVEELPGEVTTDMVLEHEN